MNKECCVSLVDFVFVDIYKTSHIHNTQNLSFNGSLENVSTREYYCINNVTKCEKLDSLNTKYNLYRFNRSNGGYVVIALANGPQSDQMDNEINTKQTEKGFTTNIIMSIEENELDHIASSIVRDNPSYTHFLKGKRYKTL